MDHFKFFSPFFKEKAQRIMDLWGNQMTEYVDKVRQDRPGLPILEAKFEWLFIKMAENEAMRINSEIAEDWKHQNLRDNGK